MTDFAVVVPTLGRPEVVRAVTSVLRQSLSPREVIVVDNGPVGSDVAELLAGAGVTDGRVTHLRLPPFSGPGMPRNVGAWQASAPYVSFLDDDDEWAPDYLARVADALAAGGVDLVFGSRAFVDADGQHVRTKRPEDVEPERWLSVLLEGRNPGVGGQNMTVRREAFLAAGGFPVDLSSGQDRHLALSMLRAGCCLATVNDAVVYLHEPVGYRATGRSTNWVNDLKILADHWDAMRWRTRIRHLRMVVARARAIHRRRRQPP